MSEENRTTVSSWWFPPLARRAFAPVVAAFGLREEPLENSNILQWIRLSGPATILVSFEPRFERIGVDVLPGPNRPPDPIGDVIDLNFILEELQVEPVAGSGVALGNDARATDVLQSFVRTLLSPTLKPIMQGDFTAIEQLRARRRPGPNIPRYLWPNPSLGHPDVAQTRSDSETRVD